MVITWTRAAISSQRSGLCRRMFVHVLISRMGTARIVVTGVALTMITILSAGQTPTLRRPIDRRTAELSLESIGRGDAMLIGPRTPLGRRKAATPVPTRFGTDATAAVVLTGKGHRPDHIAAGDNGKSERGTKHGERNRDQHNLPADRFCQSSFLSPHVHREP